MDARADLLPLRTNLLGLAGAILASALSVAWCRQDYLAAAQAHGQAQAGLSQVRSQLAQVRQQETALRRQLAAYQKLAQRGLIGAEQRLDWIEALESSRRQVGITELHYRIGPQTAWAPPWLPVAAADDFRFRASPVHLRLALRHEGELLDLLDQLGSKAPAWLRPRRCLLERLTPAETQPPGILADCDLDWISILPPLAKSESQP